MYTHMKICKTVIKAPRVNVEESKIQNLIWLIFVVYNIFPDVLLQY